MMEQNLQNLLLQKQQFQSQLQEVDSAMTETKTTETSYKIIGNIMVKTDPKKLHEELSSKKEVLTLRIDSIQKQEESIRGKAATLQKEVLEEIKEEKK